LTIGKEINRGAWGTVYEGNLNGQPVAVKKIHNALLEGAETEGTTESMLEDFHRECVLLEKADHRNVVKFYGAYYDQATGEPILVMERMKENLRDYLKRKRGKISRQEAIEICLSIARALHYLHSLPQPIVHRDLNDKNIMISEDGTVKIGDLGQSRFKEHNAVYFYSLGPGAITFMPPESLKEGARYNEKIDTFSAGVLLLQVATQHSPDVMPVNIGAVKEIVRRETDLSRLPEDHPLKPIVVQCLEDDPKKRLSTIRLYEHLNRLLMLYEYYCKVTDNAKSNEELPMDKLTVITVGLFQEMCKPLPALDRSDEVQAGILTSCAEGNLEALRCFALESSQIIPLVMNKYGWTAVHFAAYNGHLNVLKELLDTYHCDPNMKGKHKWTPVFVGARGGQMDIVKYLITEKQCFASDLTEDGRNILTAAARSGNAMLINWIMDVCQIEPVVTKFGQSVLFPIARSGNIDIFDRIVERFGLIPDEWDARKLYRPITCAAEYGHFSMVKHLFIKYNCDLRVKDKDDETLLHRAAVGGNIELVHWLVQEHGLDVHECAKDGWTALHYASRYGHLHLVGELIEKMNADVFATNLMREFGRYLPENTSF
jgi:serine/threonine protein kinase